MCVNSPTHTSWIHCPTATAGKLGSIVEFQFETLSSSELGPEGQKWMHLEGSDAD